MFRWEDSSDLCKKMFLMSHYHCPEEHLVEYGQISFFKLDKDVHALPLNYNFREVNIYGYLDEWRVVGMNPHINEMLENVTLNNDNAVLCQDSLTYTEDKELILNVVSGMVDILLTMRQRSILNRQPIIFKTGNESKQGEAGAFWQSLISCSPYILKHKDVLDFETFDAKSNVDVGITDYFNFLDALILTHLGYYATDVHKRAQMNIPETLISQDKIMARRREKLKLRENAAKRCNEIFGTDLKVISVLDTYPNQTSQMATSLYEKDINNYINSGNYKITNTGDYEEKRNLRT